MYILSYHLQNSSIFLTDNIWEFKRERERERERVPRGGGASSDVGADIRSD